MVHEDAGVAGLAERAEKVDIFDATDEIMRWARSARYRAAALGCIKWFQKPDRHYWKTPAMPKHLHRRAAKAYARGKANDAAILILVIALEIEAAERYKRSMRHLTMNKA